MAFTLHKSQLHSSGVVQVMSLQFTHVHSFICGLTLENLRSHCSTVALCCVKVTWQIIFKGSLQVTIVNAFFRMWLLTTDIYGRWCSYTVNANNGKTRYFILCEKNQEWICSNASASTSSKIDYNVRLWVWPMGLSEYLDQATLLQASLDTV